ncbi:hypothetical protein [uncultured Aquimarina sp.]|uniref:hypothetical protein n=1 Tax=uncultured Aquimarina sp. TaxID=575652 RepID=UPI0026365172|nr:hypothetical protein [uncultured Aquimarina sp.]
MLENILNLKGISQLDRNQQIIVKGGNKNANDSPFDEETPGGGCYSTGGCH